MMSNIELLKIELKKRKQGSIQETVNELAVKFNRNKKNLLADFKVLGYAGFIEVGIGTWNYKGAASSRRNKLKNSTHQS